MKEKDYEKRNRGGPDITISPGKFVGEERQRPVGYVLHRITNLYDMRNRMDF